MDGPRDCYTEGSESDTERQVSYYIADVWNQKKKRATNELIYGTEIELQM